MPTYVVELNLADREVVVVGGGRVAAFKVAGLVASGVRVRVVSRAFTPELARRTDITRVQRSYSADVLAGAAVVIACTDDRQLNHRIADDAHACGLLCNVVDDPERCDFYVPATLRRGDLTIAVGTSGASPSLAATIRDQLKSQFGPEFAMLVDALGKARGRARERIEEPSVRSEILRQLGSAHSVDLFTQQGLDAWQVWADRMMDPHLKGAPHPSRGGSEPS